MQDRFGNMQGNNQGLGYYNGAIRIARLIMFETGTYNNQFRRSYDTTIAGSGMKTVLERIGDNPTVTPTLFGSIANQFISPTATPEKEINIINGWNERRMLFMMEVESTHRLGAVGSQVITGYTDYTGVNISGAVDDRMVFYINSITQTKSRTAFNGGGRFNQTTAIETSHILANNDWESIYNPNRDIRLRPEDVFSTMSKSHLRGFGTENIVDTRALAHHIPMKTRRSNSNAAEYISKILNGYVNSAIAAPFEADENNILTTAREAVADPTMAGDAFMNAITALGSEGMRSNFTFRDLRKLDPGVDNVTEIRLLDRTQQMGMHQAGLTADWGSSDFTTHSATILSQAVPGMIAEFGLTEIAFSSTNRTHGGQVITSVSNVEGLGNGNFISHVEAFKVRLEREILADISYGGQIDFAIEMNVNLLSETWLKISIDSGPFIDYVTPSFCDALLTPLMTGVTDRAFNLATDFNSLASEIVDRRQFSMGDHSYAPTRHQSF